MWLRYTTPPSVLIAFAGIAGILGVIGRGLVVDPELALSEQVAEVNFGTKKRIEKNLQLTNQQISFYTWELGSTGEEEVLQQITLQRLAAT